MIEILSSTICDATLVEGFNLTEPIEGQLGIYELKFYPKIVFLAKGDKIKISAPIPLVKSCTISSVVQGRLIKKDNKMISITMSNGTTMVFDVDDKISQEIQDKIKNLQKVHAQDTRNHKSQFWYKEDQITQLTIDPWSTSILPNEAVLWSIQFQKGVFNKTATSTYYVTNYRIFSVDNATQEVSGLLLMSQLDDALVANTVRHTESTSYGNYNSFGRFGGMSGARFSNGTSKTTGDVYFMSNGEKVITLQGISDPTGLSRLVKSIKKQLYPEKEIQRFLKEEQKEEHGSNSKTAIECPNCKYGNLKTANFCNKCGTKLTVKCTQCDKMNPAGSSFCNKCGFALQ